VYFRPIRRTSVLVSDPTACNQEDFGSCSNSSPLSPTQWFRGDDDSLIDVDVLPTHDDLLQLNIDCDELVDKLDEADYTVWNLIVGRWPRQN
jgi:hypothetical protein